MIKALKAAGRFEQTLFMAIISLFCFAASIFRVFYSGTYALISLNWNLFLAFVPWALTSFSFLKPRIQKSPLSIALIFIFWLLFFPNAPYIITDLFHLRVIKTMPLWYDTLMILSYTWAGLFYGFLSLWDIESILGRKLSPPLITVISTILLFIGSFGIYMGRYLRWNTWDLFTKPQEVLGEIGDRLINPFGHQTTWGMTIFMGCFLNILYWSFRLIRRKPAKTM
ncbi:MAG: DUF1361 domain-containing protein [Treponema sp.]|jgi:uncharacterized membrane protein|nr:DUF1361 domain-containing protein [Treponema sp.]